MLFKTFVAQLFLSRSDPSIPKVLEGLENLMAIGEVAVTSVSLIADTAGSTCIIMDNFSCSADWACLDYVNRKIACFGGGAETHVS